MLKEIISATEKAEFNNKGFLGPYTLCSISEMNRFRPALDGMINERRRIEIIASAVCPDEGEGAPLEAIYDAHLDQPEVYALAAHGRVVDRISGLIGPDLLLWRSTFWIKSPAGRRLEWHQDTYKDEGFGSFPNVNAWIAIDETTEENCVYLVAGSHREILDLDLFRTESYLASLKCSDALPPPPVYPSERVTRMVLAPGQFFIFDGRILHGSPPNRSNARRAGLVARFIPAGTHLENLQSPSIAVAGNISPGEYRLANPPV